MFKKILSLFKLNKPKKKNEKKNDIIEDSRCKPYKKIIKCLSDNLSNIKVIAKTPTVDFKENNKDVIIIDDVSDTYILYKHVIESLSLNKKGYRFTYYLGKDSGVRFLQDLKDGIIEKDNIELLILDITLGDIYYFDSVVLLDGIDVAAIAKDYIGKDKIYFLTSHTKNYNNPIMKEYKEKYECLVGDDFESRLFNKAFERRLLLEKLL